MIAGDNGIDDCYQFTRTSGGFSAECSSKRFSKEFTVLLLRTSFGRVFQVIDQLEFEKKGVKR